MSAHDPGLWADHLRSVAGRSAGADDETWRPCRAFAAWRRKLTSESDVGDVTGIDERLWLGLAQGKAAHTLEEVLSSSEDDSVAPLVRFDESVALEVWTERELSGLHALDRVSRSLGSDAGRRRALGCARWHVANTQPDNATNRPWATHVFLRLWRLEDLPEARLYAETLLHNCQALLGAPDPLSAEILLDSAEALQEEASGERSP